MNIFVKSSGISETLSFDLEGTFTAKEFRDVLKGESISCKGLAIKLMDMDDGVSTPVRSSEGAWYDETITIDSDKEYLVKLSPKSTSNG